MLKCLHTYRLCVSVALHTLIPIHAHSSVYTLTYNVCQWHCIHLSWTFTLICSRTHRLCVPVALHTLILKHAHSSVYTLTDNVCQWLCIHLFWYMHTHLFTHSQTICVSGIAYTYPDTCTLICLHSHRLCVSVALHTLIRIHAHSSVYTLTNYVCQWHCIHLSGYMHTRLYTHSQTMCVSGIIVNYMNHLPNIFRWQFTY